MNINVIKFMDRYKKEEELREKVQHNMDLYPGSLDIRDALVEAVLLPVAEELGMPFTVEDLKNYETLHRAEQHKDVELSEDDLAAEDDDTFYWLIDCGWDNDQSRFNF